MPYSNDRVDEFDQIEGQLNGGKESIFGGQAGQGANQTLGVGGAQSENELKTTTATGDAGGAAGAGSVGGEKAGMQAAVAGGKAAGEAVQTASQNVAGPKAAGAVGSQIAQKQQTLQQESSDYLKPFEQESFKVGSDVLDKAIGRDKSAEAKVRETLAKTSTPVEKFSTKQDLSLPQVGNFQTQEGLQDILRQEGPAQRTSAGTRLDAQILAANPEFRKIQEQLAREKGDLQRSATSLQESATQSAQGFRDKALDKAKTGIKEYLGGRAKSLEDAQIEAARIENEKRKAARDQGPDQALIDRAVAERMAELTQQYAGSDPSGVLRHLDPSLVKATDYWDPSSDVKWQDAIDEEEMNQFNQINSLLGTDKAWQKGGGFTGQGGFRDQDFAKALNDAAIAKETAANADAQANIDRINKEISGRLGGIGDFRNQEAARISGEIASQYQPTVSPNPFAPYGVFDPSQIDAKQFYRDIDARSMATQADLDALSPYYAEVGGAPQYTVGPGLSASFDTAGYRNALQGLLDRLRAPARPGGDGDGKDFAPIYDDVTGLTNQWDQKTGGNVGKAKDDAGKAYSNVSRKVSGGIRR